MRNKSLYLLPMVFLALLLNAAPVLAVSVAASASPPPALFADAGFAVFMIFYLAMVGIQIASLWVLFEKAGRPGWASIVPIYNIIVWLDIIDRPWFHLFLIFIPLAGIIFPILWTVELANKFGQSGGFAVGMIFLPFIFYPILAFGGSEYEGTTPGRGKKKKKRRIRDDEDEDEEDRPRSRLKSRSRRDDDDDEDEDEDRPRRRSRRDDDDEEEEEEERPRRRPRRDDDDDEPPPRPRPRPRRDD